MKYPVVFENGDLIVLVKPHGFLTTPAREAADPRPCLGRDVQNELKIQIYPVHRLDFEVSGLVIFAKTKPAHTRAQQWFEQGTVLKTYQALSLPGDNLQKWSEWQDWNSKLVRGKRRSFEAPHGKPSLTRARAVRGTKFMDMDVWHWELMPMTGRPHQLRVEMAKHGFALLGDTLYGGKDIGLDSWLALRASRLDFSKIPAGERFGLPDVLEIESEF